MSVCVRRALTPSLPSSRSRPSAPCRNDTLLYQQAVLIALCQSFHILGISKESQSLIQSNTRDEDAPPPPHLQALQAALLQGLLLAPPACPDVAGGEQLFQAPPLPTDPRVQRVAPRHDPLAHFNRLISQPALPEAATVAAGQLAASYRDAVLLGGLELQQCQLQSRDVDADALQQLWARCVQACLQLQGPSCCAAEGNTNRPQASLQPSDTCASYTMQSAAADASLCRCCCCCVPTLVLQAPPPGGVSAAA